MPDDDILARISSLLPWDMPTAVRGALEAAQARIVMAEAALAKAANLLGLMRKRAEKAEQQVRTLEAERTGWEARAYEVLDAANAAEGYREQRDELRCSCQPQTHLEPSAWDPDCPQHGEDSEWYESEQARRKAEVERDEWKAKADHDQRHVVDLLKWGNEKAQENDSLKDDAVQVHAIRLELIRLRKKAEAEAARYRAFIQHLTLPGKPTNPVEQHIAALARDILAATEREPSEPPPEKIDLMVALKESIDAEREPNENP